jgi:hypothetical protein
VLAARVAATALALIACGRERIEPAPAAPPETRALARLVHHLTRGAPRTEAARVVAEERVLIDLPLPPHVRTCHRLQLHRATISWRLGGSLATIAR